MIRRLESQVPWWTPGTQSGYQVWTHGHLIDELCRRVTGRTLVRFYEQEIGAKFGIEFGFGMNERNDGKRAEIENGEQGEESSYEVPIDTVGYRVLGYLARGIAGVLKLEPWNSTVIAGNGMTNARGLAQIGSLLTTGHISGGEKVLSEEALRIPYQEQIYSKDLVFNDHVRFGLGFGLNSKELAFPWPHTFHWGGRGGSCVVMVPEKKASWAYVPSRFLMGRGVMDDRAVPLNDAVFECLG